MRKRRTWAWLLLTAGLLGLVAWLSSSGGSEVRAEEFEPRVPKYMSNDESTRLRQRVARANPVPDGGPLGAVVPPVPEAGPVAPKDPLIAALAAGKGKSAMVIEANSLWNSDLREPMLACLFGGEQARMLDEIRDAGFDLSQDLDRVAVTDGVLMLSGNLKNPTFLETSDFAQLGPNTRIAKEHDGTVAIWKNQLLIFGNTEEEVMKTVRQLDGEAPPTNSRVLNDRDTYGDVYGRVDVDRFARLAGEGEFKTFFDEVRRGANSVSFHVDATHDVGISLGMEGNASEEAQQLRKTLAGAIALGRLRAKATGDDRLFRLLDMAEVTPASGKDGAQFSLDLALPHAFVVELLEDCAKRHGERRKHTGATPPAPVAAP